MSKRKKRRKKPVANRPRLTESRGIEAVTVFWTTTLLATTLATLGAFLARALSIFAPAEGAAARLSVLLLIVATVTGTVGLILVTVILRWRKSPPPIALVRFGIAVCVLPILLLVWLAMAQ